MYYHECDYCGAQTGIHPSDFPLERTLPHRACHRCGQDGCRDCISGEMCEACQDTENDEAEHVECPLCEGDGFNAQGGNCDRCEGVGWERLR